MTATDQMRAMLDQLMGTSRNGENDRYSLKFHDAKVCKSFLIGCCPHEILASTRMDLGDCPKVHDLALRADFDAASKSKDYYYDIEAMEHLQAFIADCDRRTEAAKKRLAETQEELTAEVAVKANAVHQLAEEIGKKLAKAEALGEAGQVEESVQIMAEIDELRTKKTQAELEYRASMPASSYQQQKLRVCEVCSAYLGIHDNDIRLADHFGGKLHLGFMAIREKLIELEKTAGPRKADLRKNGYRSEREYDETNKYRNRYYVGGRELDRRSRVHRSRSRERIKNSTSGTTNKSSSSVIKKSRSRSRSHSHTSSSRRRSNSQERNIQRSSHHERDDRYGNERIDRGGGGGGGERNNDRGDNDRNERGVGNNRNNRGGDRNDRGGGGGGGGGGMRNDRYRDDYHRDRR